MSPRVLSVGELDEAAALLAGGAVVGIPTDTVYGLAANPVDDAAVAALFAAKRRPGAVPVAVLCASESQARTLATSWPPSAARLAARFWPGPLTLVVDAPAATAVRLGSARGLGLRVPADEVCRSLLGRTGPLAVTSANLHGDLPAATALELAAALGDEVAAVVDAGRRGGAVSTVVDLTSSVAAVLREAALSAAEVLGELR